MKSDEAQDGTASKQGFKPSDFMKSRHPELFPDTLRLSVPALESGYLEYELASLTKKKKELAFEEFSRRLSEVEICPNLKPVSGPIGGGDGKTDSETYPVAQSLVERCYWGTAKASPTSEDWAFAFSAKQKWKEKVYSDVEKIANLNRDFSVVYFITNQYVKGDKRQEVESDLSKKYGMRVYILDLSWIVKTVIDHGREELAIETLGLQVTVREKPRMGPLDTERQQDLEDLLELFREPDPFFGNDYALAEAYLKAALLARGLGEARHEVEGLFNRAYEVAGLAGDRGQIIRCGYNHAWTCYWWFDDTNSLNRIYGEIEKHLPGTLDANDCELLGNLWILLFGAVRRNCISDASSKLTLRREVLEKELERLTQDSERPNNALHAETEIYLLKILDLLEDDSGAEEVFKGLRSCIERSVGLLTYPARRFIENLIDIGESVGNLPGYDHLFEGLRILARERMSEADEGVLLYDRGSQLSSSGRFRDALRHFGQARVKLSKRETLDDMIFASLNCAIAYRAMGLKWAARMEALNAAHVCLRSQESATEYCLPALFGAKLMGGLEIELGRLSPFLAWHNLSWILLRKAQSLGHQMAAQAEELRMQEGVLACFFRNVDSSELAGFINLTECLEHLDLPLAATALLYELGETDRAHSRLKELFSLESKQVEDYFRMMKDQPAAQQLPPSFVGEAKSRAIYETALYNVRYRIDSANEIGPIAFSENLLGIIESALAMAEWQNLAFIVDRVDFFVDASESGSNPPHINLDAKPAPDGYKLVWKPDMLDWLNSRNPQVITAYLMNLLLKLLVDITIDPVEELAQELSRWNSEDVFSVAIGTSPASRALTNVLGEEAYDYRIWCNAPAAPEV